jgi:hypothetical protein
LEPLPGDHTTRTGMVVDLSELLDRHEDGFAVQTSEPLEMNRAVTLCLDLPETKTYIHGSGQVIWSDETGRGGIQFSALSESSRHITARLQEGESPLQVRPHPGGHSH